MFLRGGFCCLSCGQVKDSSHCPAATCLLSRGTASLSDPPPLPHRSRAHPPRPLSPCPIPTRCSLMLTLLCPWLTPRDPRIRWGGGKASVAMGAAHAQVFTSFSCFFRKRTHSPSSKDEQSIGLKDSLLAHSSDPVEMRRLNYQTPGRVEPSASWPPSQSRRP